MLKKLHNVFMYTYLTIVLIMKEFKFVFQTSDVNKQIFNYNTDIYIWQKININYEIISDK